jgi:hypothetical protein
LCSWEEKSEVTVFLKEQGLPLTFPPVALDESTYICGCRPDELARALGLDRLWRGNL